MGKKINARNKGNSFERKIVRDLKDMGFDVASSRLMSKALDDAKVDIYGMPMFNIQCKAVERLGCMQDILKEMPDDDGKYNLIFHKRNHKGTTVTMTLEDFYEVLMILKHEHML